VRKKNSVLKKTERENVMSINGGGGGGTLDFARAFFVRLYDLNLNTGAYFFLEFKFELSICSMLCCYSYILYIWLSQLNILDTGTGTYSTGV
jgi:hypothetical protein